MTERKPRHKTLKTSDPDFAFQIPGFPSYGVTMGGRVRRLDTGNWLSPAKAKRGGYLMVSLWESGLGKLKPVHFLVAVTFHGPRPTPKHDAAHADGNKENNHYLNIRWATRSENERDKIMHGRSNQGRRNGSARLTDEQVREIRVLAASLPRSSGGGRIKKGTWPALAKEYGVTASCLYQVINGLRWTHIS